MNDIIGVTLGWGGEPQLKFNDGKIYFKKELDYMFHKEYFPNGPDSWPIDPITGKKLEQIYVE